ncbi:unnamed protein product, partial [Darwinula stevensoni]
MALEDSARCILGNHDLHFLATYHGVRKAKKADTLKPILKAKDADTLVNWVRVCPLVREEEGILMVHAGVLPQWSCSQAMGFAAEVQDALLSRDYTDFLSAMYGNEPKRWSDKLKGDERLRMIVNALTRLRFCTADGEMDFETKEGAGSAPKGFMPWFEVPGRATAQDTIACGHWSTLGFIDHPLVLTLDTGCVWGGCLSAMRFDGGRRELLQIECGELPGVLRPS